MFGRWVEGGRKHQHLKEYFSVTVEGTSYFSMCYPQTKHVHMGQYFYTSVKSCELVQPQMPLLERFLLDISSFCRVIVIFSV